MALGKSDGSLTLKGKISGVLDRRGVRAVSHDALRKIRP